MLKRKTDDSMILKLHDKGKSQREIAKELGCSKNAILKRLRKLLGNQKEDGVSQAVRTCLKTMPRYFKDQRYLRKIGTDEIFIWTKLIAPRGDMEEVSWNGEKFVLVTRYLMRIVNDLGNRIEKDYC